VQAGTTAKTPASGGRKSVRRFENGFIIEDVAIGQPDGKLAKVSAPVLCASNPRRVHQTPWFRLACRLLVENGRLSTAHLSRACVCTATARIATAQHVLWLHTGS